MLRATIAMSRSPSAGIDTVISIGAENASAGGADTLPEYMTSCTATVSGSIAGNCPSPSASSNTTCCGVRLHKPSCSSVLAEMFVHDRVEPSARPFADTESVSKARSLHCSTPVWSGISIAAIQASIAAVRVQVLSSVTVIVGALSTISSPIVGRMSLLWTSNVTASRFRIYSARLDSHRRFSAATTAARSAGGGTLSGKLASCSPAPDIVLVGTVFAASARRYIRP